MQIDSVDTGIEVKRVADYLWEIPPTGGMRVPARIYATDAMMADILEDRAYVQAANVAHLPGIVKASLAMPDIHLGYGFPIGGVAAFEPEDGVVSPGRIGFDINCGVRLMASGLTRDRVMPNGSPPVTERIRIFSGEGRRCDAARGNPSLSGRRT